MSEIILTEKLYESFSNTIKKTELFEKIGNYKFYVTSFFLFSSIIGLTSVYLNYSNIKELCYTREQILNNQSILQSNIELNRMRNSIQHCKLKSEILNLDRQLSEIIENQKIFLIQLKEIKLLKVSDELKNFVENDTMSASTSMTSFSPTKVANLVEEYKLDTIEDGGDQEYDELLNECYDNMPLNNSKKNMTLSWLFI